MDRQVDISIIIMTYYHEQYIENAVKSVLSQKVDFSYEILISDDASKDKTLNVVAELIKENPNKIFVHTYPSNVGTTQNLYDAFLRAKGRYITLLSGDDYYCNDEKLRMQKTYLDKNPDCFAVGITTESVYTDGELTGESSPLVMYRNKDFSQKEFAEGKNYPIHGIMFRNEFQHDIIRQKFHICVEFSKYVEDMTLCLLFFEFGKVHILGDICYRITTRRPTDTNQHNFNTIVSSANSNMMTVDLIKELQRYFGEKIDLTNRLCDPSWGLLRAAIKTRKSEYLNHLKGVPITCIWKGFKNWLKNKLIKR